MNKGEVLGRLRAPDGSVTLLARLHPGKELRRRACFAIAAVMLLTSGCGLFSTDGASTTVGPDGGSLSSEDDQALVRISRGSLDSTAELTIVPSNDHATPEGSLALTDGHTVALDEDMSRSGRLDLRFDPDDLPVDSRYVYAARWNRDRDRWEIVNGGLVDDGTYRVRTSHFSDWRLFAFEPQRLLSGLVDVVLHATGFRADEPYCSTSRFEVRSDNDLVFSCAEAVDARTANLRLVDNRSYAMSISSSLESRVAHRTLGGLNEELANAVSALFDSSRLIAAGGELDLHVRLAEGQNGEVRAEPSALSLALDMGLTLVDEFLPVDVQTAKSFLECLFGIAGAAAEVAPTIDRLLPVLAGCGETVLHGAAKSLVGFVVGPLGLAGRTGDGLADQLRGLQNTTISVTNTAAPPTTTTTTPPTTTPPPAPADFGAFAGEWEAHTGRLVVGADGSAQLDYVIYSDDGNNGGGTLTFQLTSAQGSTAQGQDDGGGAVSLTLLSGGQLDLSSSSVGEFLLCGPQAVPGSCGA